MSEKQHIRGVPDSREGNTGGNGSIEEKSKNSAEVSDHRPGEGYNPPPMSVDSQGSDD